MEVSMNIYGDFKTGDKVTHPDWDGAVVTIKDFVDAGEIIARFEDGGFWRVSQLQHAANDQEGLDDVYLDDK